MPDVLRVVAMVVAASVVVRAPARAAESPTLVIQVIDYAHASGGALEVAQHHVARVFGVAGISVVWREVAHAVPATGTQVTVLILSDPMTAAKTTKDKIANDVLGTAVPPTQRAWIFLGRIEDIASADGCSTGLILGHVIAHEVAHMVANIGHSEAGVMASAYHPAETLQAFTSDQSRRLRAAVQTNSKPVILDARARARPFQPDRR